MNGIKQLFRFIAEEPFIAATGIAAGVHSTWSFAMFSGPLPAWETQKLQLALVLLTSFLLAFAIDVGQIKTSHDIRKGQRNFTKIITFVVLAVGTYYLQWFYLVHHAPALALGDGVRDAWQPYVQIARDAWIFALPAFLPVATTLYTISNVKPQRRTQRRRFTVRLPWQSKASDAITTQAEAFEPQFTLDEGTDFAIMDYVVENPDESWTGFCPYYSDEFVKPTQAKAKYALIAHQKKHKPKAHANGNAKRAEIEI